MINVSNLNKALKVAHQYTIRPELVSISRPRLPELGVNNSLNPLEALKTYLKNREDLQDISQDLLEAAQILLNGEVLETSESKTRQLRLF